MTIETLSLKEAQKETAPDGSEVRVLLRQAGGSMAHFTLPPCSVSTAIRHKRCDEIWYILEGAGQMWRDGEMTDLAPGLCLTIPAGTAFQFRNRGSTPFKALGVTMPPWPGDSEAEFVTGAWT